MRPRTIFEIIVVLVGPFIVTLPFSDPAEGIIAGGICFFIAVVALACLGDSRREKIIDDYADYLERGSQGPYPHPPKDILRSLKDARHKTKAPEKRLRFDLAITRIEAEMRRDPQREAEAQKIVAEVRARRAAQGGAG